MVMGAGLRVWDANGNIIFDTPDRMGRIVGVVGTSALTFTAPTGCTPYWFYSGVPTITGIPSISVSGQTVNFPASDGKSIFYGYY